jgi:hypothetical protein
MNCGTTEKPSSRLFNLGMEINRLAKLLPRETLIKNILSTAEWMRDQRFRPYYTNLNDIYSRQLCAVSENLAYRPVNSGRQHPLGGSSKILWKPVFLSDEDEMLYLLKYKGRTEF